MIMERGKIIVVEGIDASGKGTQVRALAETLNKHFDVRTDIFSFPIYEGTLFGPLLDKLLHGQKFDGIDYLNPDTAYLLFPLFALNRVEGVPAIEKAVSGGRWPLLDRYIPANFHQASKFPKGEGREKFIELFEKTEYELLKLPREDVVVFLDVDPKYTRRLAILRATEQAGKDGKRLRGMDIAEQNFAHQQSAAEIYRDIAGRREHWIRIDCMKTPEEIKEATQITREIVEGLQRHKILPR